MLSPSVSLDGPTVTTSNMAEDMDPIHKTFHPDPKPLSQSLTRSVPNGTNGQSVPKHHHLWLVTGCAGTGKTTVGQNLAKDLGLPFIEGDSFHPPANIEKMSKGIPLHDADRWDWLILLREESLRQFNSGNRGIVMTCSALKRKYRDVIRVAPYYSHDVVVHFVYLHAPEAVIQQRVGLRKGHYMKANMVHSQFEDLEPPSAEEADVISVDVSKSPEEVGIEVLEKARQKMKEAAEAN